jgi:hypothetical protein
MRRHIFPWLLYPLPLILSALHRIREKRFPQPNAAMWRNVALIAMFIVVNWLTVTILSPFPHFRYLAPVIPAFWLIGALMLDRWMRVHWVIGVAVLILLFFAGTSRDFIYELTHDYDGPVEGTVKYLLANGNDGDVVVAPREEMPLKFYTKMKVIGGLSEEHAVPPKDPDWVILRTVLLPTEHELAQRTGEVLDRSKYEMVVLDGYPDIPFENREEPVVSGHSFRTVTERPPVQLLRRVSD